MQLNFKVYGSEKPPLVVIHGLFGTADNWQTLAKIWSADFTVYALDMRNHGRSPFADSHTYEDMSSDILDFFNANKIEKAHILGHSMGGKAAIHFATKHENRIEKLLIADIAPKNYRDSAGKGGHEHVFEALFAVDLSANPSRGEVQKTLEMYLPNDVATVQFLLKNLSRDADTNALVWKINIPVLHRYYPIIMGAIEILKPISLPTLFLRGARSNYITIADWLHIRAHFTDVRLVDIAGAGHWVHAENPSDFSRAVLDFLT